MKAEPDFVDSTRPSLKFRRNWTAGEASEPNVAVAMMHVVLGFVTLKVAEAESPVFDVAVSV